jgi:hypothetical protein
MSFSAEWLALREPHDLRARNSAVRDAVAATFAGRPSIGVVDLACGTGSTLRALAPHLPARQDWRLVDNDLGLLGRAAENSTLGVRVTTVPVDLVRDLELALDGLLDLVTMSALLDLVSAAWLERLAVEAAARRLPLYAALTYDGRIAFEPSDPYDARIIAAVNSHQCRDKGFGPALGPGAAQSAIDQFERVGYEVESGAADWLFDPQHREIQIETLGGFAVAAREMDLPLGEVEAWLTRRGDLVAAGRSSLRVGHFDFFARPTGTR